MAKRRGRPAAMKGNVALDAITEFEGLIEYLRDELDWELPEEPRFEDVTYTWKASEIGLDLKEPIEIAQLRPARSNQPWGIFFLNFPQRQLPVTVLRRILRGLSRRKRASWNPAERAVWNKDDLLFVSAVGEAGDRRLAFAHFQDRGADLPTLRVIEWDADDTVRRLSSVDRTLREHLRWQEQGESLDTWRERWRGAFSERPREAVRTADDLAQALAKLARRIRERINVILPQEAVGGPLKQLYEAVKATLARDLDTDKFADTYAQTIAYGLLSARINQVERWQARAGDGSKPLVDPVTDLADITADAAGEAMPVTNPFLRELFGAFMKAGGRDDAAGLDFDELGVSEVVDFLNGLGSRLHTVLDNFDKDRAGEDPVIHLYEGFLKAYDARLRQTRGVYYTPKPVVGFIVRSVDEVLRTEFGLADGLADATTWGEFVATHPEATIPDGVGRDEPFVRILDPATGTGTFLVEIIDLIHARLSTEKWCGKSEAEKQRLWSEWVPRHLLPRLYGYELMMAPYAVAHMKIGLKLQETGYDFAGTEASPDGGRRPARARVFLTNALEPAQDLDTQLAFMSEALAHEALAANDAKARAWFTVVVGNPPYSNYSANLTNSARDLVAEYRLYNGQPIKERNSLQFERNIQDDYVKFITVARRANEQVSVGVVALITNATMLYSRSLKGLRERLVDQFDSINSLNLHGGTNETGLSTFDDENVFDISQAVAINLYRRDASKRGRSHFYKDFVGRRSQKYHDLNRLSIGSEKWVRLTPTLNNLSFLPSDANASVLLAVRASDVFEQYGAGVKTGRDAIAIGFSPEDVEASASTFLGRRISTEERKNIRIILYRPFDLRYIYYNKQLVDSQSIPTMKNMAAGRNVGLIASSSWTSADNFSVNVSSYVVEMKTGTHDRGTSFFPALRVDSFLNEVCSNIKRGFADLWRNNLQALGARESKTLDESCDPRRILYWIYGVCHSPDFRAKYRGPNAEGLPIVLLPGSLSIFCELVSIGERLVALHLLDAAAPELANPKPRFVGEDEARVERGYPERHANGRVYINPRRWFEPVPESVWTHPIGGYKPAEKWLKDRSAKGGKRPSPGRVLTDDDILHYRRIVVALDETAKAMTAIDVVIARHGGWPDAFRGMSDAPPADGDRPGRPA